MKGAFSIFIFLLFASLVSAQFPQDLYRIKLEYNNGTVTLKNVSSIFSYFQETKNQPENSYKIQIENSNGNTLFQEKFNFPLILTDPYAILDNAEKTLYAPCTKDSFKLKVFSPSNEKLLEKGLKNCAATTGGKYEEKDFRPNKLSIFLPLSALILLILAIIVFSLKRKKQ